MTVLEKIKRCVSLVWDFQEIYGEEDIEDFCSNELHTYPQHNEIMEYFKHVEELEKENAELKEKYVKNITDCDICDTYCNSQFTKAKEIIREFVEWATWQGNSKCPSFKDIQDKAEQFLNSEEK